MIKLLDNLVEKILELEILDIGEFKEIEFLILEILLEKLDSKKKLKKLEIVDKE